MATDLKQKFISFVEDEKLFNADQKPLVGCSGGIDSMVLCHLLLSHDISFEVAHVNYRLRKKASDGDEYFVKEFCQQYFIPCHVERVFKRSSGNVQSWARKIRYNFFEKIRVENNLDVILTAHHFDDQIETFILNFTRGTGLSGLIGIQSKNALVRRPLLFARKQEIMEYAKKNKIKWREDETNEADYYARNKIRHHITPIVEELRENDEGMRLSLQNLKHLNLWITSHFDNELKNHKVNSDEWQFDLKNYNSESDKFELYHLLRNLGFNFDQVSQMISSQRSGTLFRSDTHIATNDHGIIRCRKNRLTQLPEKRIELIKSTLRLDIGPHALDFSVSNETQFERDDSKAYFDYDKLVWPLTLRPWQAGDRFQPFGMYGKQKKVSDLLAQLKLSHFEKEETVVLVDANDSILWVVGYRRSILAPINEQTKSCLIVKLIQ